MGDGRGRTSRGPQKKTRTEEGREKKEGEKPRLTSTTPKAMEWENHLVAVETKLAALRVAFVTLKDEFAGVAAGGDFVSLEDEIDDQNRLLKRRNLQA
ncbi:hypothetical protein RJT34_26723 [Clitoria ternatea]|uniref:Uncharacterized protein n=1 Tax=Clitoria ternatea TaxID=43366 RepID=A0AAN9F988_CLITE